MRNNGFVTKIREKNDKVINNVRRPLERPPISSPFFAPHVTYKTPLILIIRSNR